MIRRRTALLALIAALFVGALSTSTQGDSFFRLKRYLETKGTPALSGSNPTGTLTIDLSSGSHQTVVLDRTCTTVSFTNAPPTGYAAAWTLALAQDGTGSRAVSGWPASVKWAGGGAPTLSTTASKVDIFSFLTYDGGTTWYGVIIGLGF